jgi:hypothetical protein
LRTICGITFQPIASNYQQSLRVYPTNVEIRARISHIAETEQKEDKMAGRFEGLSDLEWKLFEDLLPQSPEKRGRGMPHVPFRKVLNTQLYVLITGCRWCDIPRGAQWASKSSAHRWRSAMV